MRSKLAQVCPFPSGRAAGGGIRAHQGPLALQGGARLRGHHQCLRPVACRSRGSARLSLAEALPYKGNITIVLFMSLLFFLFLLLLLSLLLFLFLLLSLLLFLFLFLSLLLFLFLFWGGRGRERWPHDLAVVVKKREPQMASPGKWKHGPKPAVPCWFNFDPYPFYHGQSHPLSGGLKGNNPFF